MFLIVAVDVLGLTLMIPLLPFYAERMGASPAQVGWLIGIYAACQLVSGPFLGRWSDSTGRKPLLIVSQLGTCLGFIVTAFAPNLWVLFIARAIDGLTAGNLSLAQAYISDVTKPEERAKAFGLIGIAFGLGFLIGPAVSGLLSRFDYRLPIFAAAALSAASVLTTWLLLPAVTPGGGGAAPARRLTLFEWRAYAVYFREPRLSSKLWQFLLFSLGFSMFVAGMPLFVERRLTWNGQPFGPEQVGYVWALAGLFGVLWQGPALGRLVNAFGELRLNRAGFVGYVGGYTILAFSTSVPWLVARDRGHVDGVAGAPGSHQPDHTRRAARGTGRGAGADAVAQLRRADRRTADCRLPDRARPADDLGPGRGRDGGDGPVPGLAG